MSSPKRTDQDSSSTSERDGESTQDSEMDVNVEIKEEPADSGYEKAPITPGHSENNSNSNSRTSSPCPPVHFGSGSPAQGRDSPSQGAGSSSSGPQTPVNDVCSSSSIRTHLQGNSGKKTDTVQNIVEGLLKKNATLLAMSDTEGLRPQRRTKAQDFNTGRRDQNASSVTASAVFPVSSTSQVKLVQNQGRKSETSKPMLLRPKSPTKKCDAILRDKSQLSYSLMESPVGDEAIEKIFKVQNHELVCAVSSKPYIFDKVNNEKTVVASLDNNYFWCNFCSFSSSNKSLITNHVTDHRFSCKYCPYESFCRSDILRHMSKMHEEFEEMSNNLSYCTFLSDYVRVKSRAEGKENDVPKIDQDKDVDELDTEIMKSYQVANLKRKKEREDSLESVSSEKYIKMDSPGEAIANGPRSDRQGKSRKSQNPRRHPQVNEKDYDTFEMEVEEIDETENGTETHTDRILYPSSTPENSNDHKNPSTAMGSHMQLIPSLQDEGTSGYTATHVTRPPQGRTGRPPTYMANNRVNNRGTHRTASASSLYWSCGYCDFQSSSQAEIKEHSNRTHPGKPHRYVALIKNMTPDTIINKNVGKGNDFNNRSSTSPAVRDNMSSAKTNSFSSVKLDNVATNIDGDAMSDDIVSLKNNKADDNLLKVKLGTPRGPKKETTTYKCYHCTYTAKRHSSMKSHIYYKHRGKGLLAVDEESSVGEQVFFCARDDCTFKSVVPTAYLNHVEQCTPWHKPELADVEVEPHIRECLQQTVTFAEMALDKVLIRNTVLTHKSAPAVDERGICDSSPPPDNVDNMDKENLEAESLPSSPTRFDCLARDVNTLDLDQPEEHFSRNCIDYDQGLENPHVAFAKEHGCQEGYDSESDEVKDIKSEKDNGEFCNNNNDSKFSVSDSGDGQETEAETENATRKRSSKEKEAGSSSSSLKLTFRVIGDTTVCSMNDSSKTQSDDVTEPSSSSLNEKMSRSDTRLYSKQLVDELLDSFSDSDSDKSSVDPRSLASMSPFSDDGDSGDRNTKEMKKGIVEKKVEVSTEQLSHTDFSKNLSTSHLSVEKNDEEKIHLSYVPARSAAVKAMTKMKPVIDDEVGDIEEDQPEYSGGKKSALKHNQEEGSSTGSNNKSCPVPLPSKFAIYTCHYCNNFEPSPLRKVKSHLVNQHSSVLPIVENVKEKSKKKNTLYVCPFSSCNKLFSDYYNLALHRSSHSIPTCNTSSSKDRQNVNSCNTTADVSSLPSVQSSFIHVPSEAKNIPHCRVVLYPLDKSELDRLHLTTHSKQRNIERYECLYCTEHFSHSSLSGMKHHHAAEHAGQLLVLRDVEAKKEKMASRIYACEERECEFIALSRVELDAHEQCHKSNCTFVYECAGCGWYSSSFWTAKDHLKNEHSDQNNTYLIHMQLSVDENGQTSKKVLRSI